MTAQDEVLAAAATLVAAFGSHDVPTYFDSFDEDASFLFHDLDHLLPTRAAYQDLWHTWESGGFRVLGCRSLDPRVQVISPESAVFTHRVRTTIEGAGGEAAERETIVFRRAGDGRWLGVHEHLSIEPEPAAEPAASEGLS